MPEITAPAKVLVTGSSSFIAIWVVRYLLECGFSVRGAVRSEDKGKHLLDTFKDAVSKGMFELAIVPDMCAPGAFDEAVKGVTAIEHTASPVHANADDPNEIIVPAIRGTLGVLESALKYAGPQIKRVVVTSSCAAIFSSSPQGELDETCWNEECLNEVNEKGRLASAINKYRASKTLAEKAAWKFVEDHKDEINWDLVTINPPYVFGPILHQVKGIDTLNVSSLWFYNALFSKDESISKDTLHDILLPRGWVDVRDVANAHVRALTTPGAGGQRFIISAGSNSWKDWSDVAIDLHIEGIKRYETGSEPVPKVGRYNASKSREVLGIKYREMKDIAKDTIQSFKEHGW
ncbi:D-lactaldehyde dehydrogenase [Pyrrhoderma noxium]|uniref:D-lactaldehyde dehydrogenase n=1 Tax=Pyrrhoderma noxium TaxID=2282107 RepID=A0A286UDF6_9AGAM|nr:D-lactaldehyde dehydrogenase [Pyrrhoderma noxium]